MTLVCCGGRLDAARRRRRRARRGLDRVDPQSAAAAAAADPVADPLADLLADPVADPPDSESAVAGSEDLRLASPVNGGRTRPPEPRRQLASRSPRTVNSRNWFRFASILSHQYTTTFTKHSQFAGSLNSSYFLSTVTFDLSFTNRTTSAATSRYEPLVSDARSLTISPEIV